jgi:SAM-dependent methyltransferase
MDPEQYRAAQRDQWARSAGGWSRRREDFQRSALPVSRWLIDAARLQPGHTVLELAAGPGDTGLLAAELVQPGGRLISSDASEEMVAVSRARAQELGIDDVEFRVLDLEWIDLETASVDAALCRWGYMLAADPGAALRETRRVLRPGGRVALAAWDAPEHNPWATVPTDELVERGLTERRDPSQPGMFAFSPPGKLESLLQDAGFTEVEVDAVEVEYRFESADAYWETILDMSVPFADSVGALEEAQHEAVRDGVRARLEPYTGGDGAVVLPWRTLVAAATA